MDEEKKLDDILKERLQELPKAVRDAIASAELEKKLQELAERHKLHLDKWDALENEVMLTLLGLESIDKLEENIKNEVGVPAETASALAEDIAEKIFLPIREELERELPPQETAGGENADAAPPILNTEYRIPNTVSPLPSTPPPPPKTEKAVRAPVSESYMSQTPSHERKAVEGDPYREAVS